MIELRWLNRWVERPNGMMFISDVKTVPCMPRWQESVLQYRNFSHWSSDGYGQQSPVWSAWIDVPTVSDPAASQPTSALDPLSPRPDKP